MQLKDKVAIITGASSGIGWATAKELSAAGMKLVLTARRAKQLEALEKELAGPCVAVDGDITDPQLPAVLLDTAQQRFGQVDVVFNNAGVMNIGTVDDADVEALASMIRTNVEAATRVAYAALRVFKKQGHGDLVNTSSVLGMKVRPGVGVYAGTKYAIEAMSEALRLELAGTGVRVMVIEPGYTATSLQSHWTSKQKEPLKGVEQPVQPEDIARAVKFMLEQPAHVLVARLLMVPAQQQL
ncbi:MAG: SDR family oxidoreductase [Phycisphaeraceae bacterium]